MTITQFGIYASPQLLDAITTNMLDLEMSFRGAGPSDEAINPQVLTEGHVTMKLEAGTAPPTPSFLTRGTVVEILWVLRRLVVQYGPRDIEEADVRRDWRPVARFSVEMGE